MSYKDQIDKSRMPKHVAIIMDGNGRWAKRQGKERIYGHQHGVDSVDSVLEGPSRQDSNTLLYMPSPLKTGTDPSLRWMH